MKRHLLFAIILLLPAIVHAQYTIKVHPNNAEYGNAEGGGTFSDGDSCTVIAHANQGCEFVNWTENNNVVWPNEIYPFVVTDNRILYANFRQLPEYNIDAEVIPEGAGDVTGYGTYYEGDTCTLTAIPASGFKFGRWEKDGIVVSTDSIHSFTVTGNAFYTAYFDTIFYNISATVIPEGAGDVTGWGSYPEGDTCTLTATANPGYSFSHWQDGITDNPRTITVVADSSFTAYFAQDNYTIEVYAEPSEGGTVSGGGDNFHYGETATLTAMANPGYSFSHWQDGITDSPRTITVVADSSFTAYFVQDNYTIEVYANPSEGGTVSGGGDNYHYGDLCTLTAGPADGFVFSNWTKNDSIVSTDSIYAFTVTESADYVAHFTEAPCIDIQEIAAKEHKEGNDTYILILVYPNPNDEEYEYQWQFSTDSLHFSDLHEGTYNKQYYYKGGRLRDGYYKVRVSKDGCSEETKPYYVNNNSHLRIYPNPSRRGNNIIVVNDCDGPAQLAIYSTDGRLLHTQTVTDSQATVSISLPQGVYIAYFTDNNGYTKVGKLIIQ